ncbi:YraN family protein [Craterilacuibacter sinensis]|uniref:UPF0102 protein GQF02_13000 n=1 Tax=Craterilacuibacter sinensis TaxID=2686017 RepID=A0A845BR63_9NEIS|nr:YraN family protein [Craterilacuibacter sinensis]MXR37890.1 YraN family protein [Craterilacuibacter sinensis]
MGQGRATVAASGVAAEDRALRYLQKQGLRLVERNWHCRGGELDLVMREGVYWVFVEVRLRTSSRFGSALQSIDGRKCARLVHAASLYLSEKHIDAPCRFDAVVFEGEADPLWIKDIIA